MFSKGPPLVVVVVCESNSPPKFGKLRALLKKYGVCRSVGPDSSEATTVKLTVMGPAIDTDHTCVMCRYARDRGIVVACGDQAAARRLRSTIYVSSRGNNGTATTPRAVLPRVCVSRGMDAGRLLGASYWSTDSSGPEGGSTPPAEYHTWNSTSSTSSPSSSSTTSDSMASDGSGLGDLSVVSPARPISSSGSASASSGCSGETEDLLLAALDQPLQWEQVLDVLHGRGLGGRHLPGRPVKLDHNVQHAVFLEAPKVRRRPGGSDVWACSGGKKGSSYFWFPSGSGGIRKRYGTVKRKCAPGGDDRLHKYHEFTLLSGDSIQNAVEHKATTVFEVFSSEWSKTRRESSKSKLKQAAQEKLQQAASKAAGASHVFERAKGPGQLHGVGAVVDVRWRQGPGGGAARSSHGAAATPKFVSFSHQDTSSGSEFELGAIVQQGGGVTLTSGQGDFAEWHRRRAGEPPFEEGDVIGFDRQGLISRRTAGATMLGVISRKAVVEGSTPAAHERMEFDTVAYCGVVPVRARRSKPDGAAVCECDFSPHGPAVGDLLVPSGLNDGVAVLSSGASNTSNRVAVVAAHHAWPCSVDGPSPEMLVSAMVTSPAETIRSGKYKPKRLVQCLGVLTLMIGVLWVLGLLLQPGETLVQDAKHPVGSAHSLPAAFVVTANKTRRPAVITGRRRSNFYASARRAPVAPSKLGGTFFSGVYAKTALTCNGRPVYQMGRDDERGAVLVLVEKAPNWGSYSPGLHWTVRLKEAGELLTSTEDERCNGPWNKTVLVPGPLSNFLGSLGDMLELLPLHDGADVGGWASDCKDRPDAVDCIWHSSEHLGTIQVVSTDRCAYPTASCGIYATACYKVPAAANLAATRCDAPALYVEGEPRPLIDPDAGCVACTCKALGPDQFGFMSMHIGQQYCANGFMVNGTLDQRHAGVYVVTHSFCNGKPVFRMKQAAGPDGYGWIWMDPVLFQPTGTDIWAIDASGWDAGGWDRAAVVSSANAHEDHCLLVNATASSSANTQGCSASPDCASGWAEQGQPNQQFRVQPLHSDWGEL